MTNRSCNLECENDPEEDEIVEFVGPVKIILVNPSKNSYRDKVCNAAFVVLAQMAMAVVCLLVTFYSLTYTKKNFLKALHIYLSTTGLLLLLPSGVLTMNGLNGAAEPMRQSDRRLEHAVVQFFGLGTSMAGSAASFFAEYPKLITAHSILGFLANSLALLSALVGMLTYLICHKLSIDAPVIIYIHYALGALTLSISLACFLLGIINNSFKKWFPVEEMMYCVGIFSIFYICVVIYKPLHFWRNNDK